MSITRLIDLAEVVRQGVLPPGFPTPSEMLAHCCPTPPASIDGWRKLDPEERLRLGDVTIDSFGRVHWADIRPNPTSARQYTCDFYRHPAANPSAPDHVCSSNVAETLVKGGYAFQKSIPTEDQLYTDMYGGSSDLLQPPPANMAAKGWIKLGPDDITRAGDVAAMDAVGKKPGHWIAYTFLKRRVGAFSYGIWRHPSRA